jgi:hypothetical protein
VFKSTISPPPSLGQLLDDLGEHFLPPLPLRRGRGTPWTRPGEASDVADIAESLRTGSTGPDRRCAARARCALPAPLRGRAALVGADERRDGAEAAAPPAARGAACGCAPLRSVVAPRLLAR